ncbi:hypothetical protein QAD02_007284 [Eretmocerus hayati]|uniref:Uncharacterized protein n=1 Tax=Eretmocerus hayati TaxID=131215 RepID=A0ACC2N5P1_9HYME|nr:hypothetical protein QAD02_007284 [Eretmocerus hayati]
MLAAWFQGMWQEISGREVVRRTCADMELVSSHPMDGGRRETPLERSIEREEEDGECVCPEATVLSESAEEQVGCKIDEEFPKLTAQGHGKEGDLEGNDTLMFSVLNCRDYESHYAVTITAQQEYGRELTGCPVSESIRSNLELPGSLSHSGEIWTLRDIMSRSVWSCSNEFTITTAFRTSKCHYFVISAHQTILRSTTNA